MANIDQALIVFAVTDPKPHIHLLDRFLVTMESREIPAVLCFNKTDIAESPEIAELQDIYASCGSVSRKIARGRHTTRHSELIVLGEDSYIMDTPGFSSLYIDDLQKEDLKYYFPEFLPFEGMCRFNGCSHIHEPGCAVAEAVESGRIHRIRYRDYVDMYHELEERKRY